MELVGDGRRGCQEMPSWKGDAFIDFYMMIRRKLGWMGRMQWEWNYIEAPETSEKSYSRTEYPLWVVERQELHIFLLWSSVLLSVQSTCVYLVCAVFSYIYSVFIFQQVYSFIDFPSQFYPLKNVISLVHHGHTEYYSYLLRPSTCSLQI